MKSAILGGTGREGSGLVLRWGAFGKEMIIGSRDAGRAAAAALVMGRTGRISVVLIRGCRYVRGEERASMLFRLPERDLFRFR